MCIIRWESLMTLNIYRLKDYHAANAYLLPSLFFLVILLPLTGNPTKPTKASDKLTRFSFIPVVGR